MQDSIRNLQRISMYSAIHLHQYFMICHYVVSLCSCLLQTVSVELQTSWRSPEDWSHDGGVCLQVLPMQSWRLPIHRYHTHTYTQTPQHIHESESDRQSRKDTMDQPDHLSVRSMLLPSAHSSAGPVRVVQILSMWPKRWRFSWKTDEYEPPLMTHVCFYRILRFIFLFSSILTEPAVCG